MTNTFTHIPALIQQASGLNDSQSVSDLNSETDVNRRVFMEETVVILTKYKANKETQHLKHWIKSEYILPEGAMFVCRMIRHGLDNAPTGPEKIDILLEIEAYLRCIVIGLLRSFAGTTPSCPTPETLDLSLSDISRAAVSQTRTPGYDLLLLERDEFRCQITKMYSNNGYNALKKFGKPEKAAELDALSEAEGVITDTQAAHIIPFNLGEFTGGSDEEAKMRAWKGLYHVFPEIRELIAPESINSPRNALTLAACVHSAFGQFSFGLCPMGNNHYHLITFDRLAQREPLKYFFDKLPVNTQGHRTVKFTYAPGTPDDSKVSDTLLRVHLAICQIYHLLGGADVFDDYLPSDEESGSSATRAYVDGRCPQFGADLARRLRDLG